MFRAFWGSQGQQSQPRPQDSSESLYPSSVNSQSSSLPTTPSSAASSSFNVQNPSERQCPSGHVSPADAASIIALLKDKSIDELRKLLSDKNAYQNLLLLLDPVKTQNKVRDELRNETMKLASKNLEREPQITELRNQCRIIRTTELEPAKENLLALEKRKEETLQLYSPASLLNQLLESVNKTEEDSEALHRQLLDKEIDFAAFVQKYKKLRNTHHKQALTQLAAKTAVTGCT